MVVEEKPCIQGLGSQTSFAKTAPVAMFTAILRGHVWCLGTVPLSISDKRGGLHLIETAIEVTPSGVCST